MRKSIRVCVTLDFVFCFKINADKKQLYMKKTITLLSLYLLCLSSFTSFSQNDITWYRSSGNMFYWKNRNPEKGYWQQDVYYKIKASIDEKTDIITGNEELIYFNNSPHELSFVYFHLYQNAFQPDSYYDDLLKLNNVNPKYGNYELQKLGTVVEKITHEGILLKTELDNTILKVYLSKPLKQGESITFNIDFKTYFQLNTPIRRRMKTFIPFQGFKHYDGTHWYPRIAVYDKKMGWDTDQHLEKEFYGNYGIFDVELTFANNMIVEATGVLQNKNEVLPDELRKKLDIKNFADKPLNSAPSVIIPYDSTARKTWKFHAENVHDFAFTADPTYRIGEVNWNNIQVIALAQEGVASRWQYTAAYTAKVIQVFSESFGMYAYPKIIVADARDGMEYPMLALCGGTDPGNRDLIAHEVGHNWFMGMIGSNETYRAMLDEGFTQFITNWAYERIDGKYRIQGIPASKYVRKHLKKDLVRNSEVYFGYMYQAIREIDENINTHSSGYNSALRHGGGYSLVYSKTAVMLYNLQYVLGDDLFIKAMQNYFKEWQFKHPYIEDFKTSIINYTKVDLNWFFDEWIDTDKTIDYSIVSVKKGKEKNKYEIHLKRKGRMQMPLDIKVTAANDSAYYFHIPNIWFIKETNAIILPKWYGWDKINDEYTAIISVPGGIKNIEIDPTHRLADINMLDNSKKFPVEINFDSKIYNPASWEKYTLNIRPDLWYNSFDGVKTGIHFNGTYANIKHNFDLTAWYNSGLGQQKLAHESYKKNFDAVSYRFNYSTPTYKLARYSSVSVSAKSLDGMESYSVGIDKKDKSGMNKGYVVFKSMIRKDTSDLNYLIYSDNWGINQLNNTITLGFQHLYRYPKGNGDIQMSLRSSTLESDYNYAYANLTVVNKNNLWKLNFNTRITAQYGAGEKWAPESKLFAAGANPEEMMDNKYIRSAGIVPVDWNGFGAQVNHFNAGGGLNLRGYSGYLCPFVDENGNVLYAYNGSGGAAFNAELEFDQLLKWGSPKFFRKTLSKIKSRIKINTYMFGDIGIINYTNNINEVQFADYRADAGIGVALTIKRFWVLQTVEPLVIRFDMPLFLNRIPAVESTNTAFRWVIGVNRAF